MANKTYTHSTLETVFYVSVGVILCIIAIRIYGFLYGESHSLLGTLFLGIFLSIPILLCGLYVIISTLRYKVELTDDEIVIKERIFKTTKVKKETIQAQRLTGVQELELKTKKGVINQYMPEEFSSDPDFEAWLEPIKKVPEYKGTEGFNPLRYPYITYRPTAKYTLMRLCICMLLIMMPIFFLKGLTMSQLQNSNAAIWLLVILGLYLYLFISQTCSVIVGTIGYQVTLTPKSLKIKSMTGCFEIQRDQIITCNYSHDGRGGRRWIPTLWLTVNNRKKEVIVFLPFERDQRFNDWFAGIKVPLMGNPLPKIEQKL